MDEVKVNLQKKKETGDATTQQWITSKLYDSENNKYNLQFSIKCSVDDGNDMVLSVGPLDDTDMKLRIRGKVNAGIMQS